MDAKACAKCRQVLPLGSFSPHARMKMGRQSYCKPFARQWHKENPEYVAKKNEAWRAQNPDYARDWQRAKKLGATKDWVEAALTRQENKCAGCLREFGRLREHVDHCHATGRLRGLLCRDCNLVLGRVRDSEETLSRLANYLAGQSQKEAY